MADKKLLITASHNSSSRRVLVHQKEDFSYDELVIMLTRLFPELEDLNDPMSPEPSINVQFKCGTTNLWIDIHDDNDLATTILVSDDEQASNNSQFVRLILRIF